jgi:uncharacterized protein YjbJ (UPF0337 family)
VLVVAAASEGRAGREDVAMNWDIVQGKWKQMKGEARKQWGKLTDDDWDAAAGEKDKFLGKLQERYGWTKDEAERSADEYFSRMP